MNEGTGRPRRRFQIVGEVISELSKVHWPSRQDTMRLTMLVVAVSAVMGVFLGLLDFGFNEAAKRIFG